MISGPAPRAVELLARNWWTLVVRGGIAIVFGLLAMILPLATLVGLVWLFGAYAFIDGLFAIAAAVRGSAARAWWMWLLEGIAGLVIGLVSFVWPGLTAVALVYIIAAWALLTGVLEIVAAIRLRKEITGEWWLAAGGVLSIVLGAILAVAPGAGAVALIWLLGVYAILFGVILLGLGYKLRHFRLGRDQLATGPA